MKPAAFVWSALVRKTTVRRVACARLRAGGWKALASLLLAGLLALFCPAAPAAIESGDFADDGQRQRFYQLTRELRCPKCQNQDIADSNAPIAADLRREIHRLLDAGYSNAQITEHMVERYGEFVRYKPALNRRTWLLWFAPISLLGAGFLLLALLLLQRRKLLAASPLPLSAEEQARLGALLKQGNEGKADA